MLRKQQAADAFIIFFLVDVQSPKLFTLPSLSLMKEHSHTKAGKKKIKL